ncbi:MAG: polyketide synthase dehydratase domain-containing protein [bacterium]
MFENWKNISGNYQVKDLCANLAAGRESFDLRLGSAIETEADLENFLKKPDSVVPRRRASSICLRIGAIPDFNDDQLRPLLLRNSAFKRRIGDVLAAFRKIGIKYENIKQQKNETDKRLFRFMITYSAMISLKDLGVDINLISYESSGVWTALAVSGVIGLEDTAALLFGKINIQAVKFCRPRIPFLDPVTGKTFLPYVFDEPYLTFLIDGLSIEENVFCNYINDARLLARNQFTFKKYLEEWDVHMNNAGLEIEKLLFDDRLTWEPAKFLRERLLLMVIIVSSFYRLHEKWSLSREKPVKDQRFYELLDLVMDGEMPRDLLIKYIFSRTDFSSIAKILTANQSKMKAKTPYQYIKERNRRLEEIVNISKWLDDAASCKGILLDAEDIIYIEAGNFIISAPPEKSIVIEISKNIEKTVRNALFQLWLNGFNIKLELLYQDGTYNKLPLPVYPFDRKSFWLGKDTVVEGPFRKVFSATDPIIRDHVITGKTIIPAASLLDMALAANPQSAGLHNVVIHGAGIVEKELEATVEIDPETNHFTIKKEAKDVLCKGVYRTKKPEPPPAINLSELINRKPENINNLYPLFHKRGYNYGTGLQVIKKLWVNGSNYIFELEDKEQSAHGGGYLNPRILDGMLQSALAVNLLENEAGEEDSIFIPYIFESLDLFGEIGKHCFVSINKDEILQQQDDLKVNIAAYDGNGNCIARLRL